MKKLSKLAIAVGLASGLVALPSFANQISLDIGVDTDSDGDTRTAAFDYFTLENLTPTSIYFDVDGNGVSTGDIVIDAANSSVGQLNGTADGEVFPTSWGLDIDWVLVGFAGVLDAPSPDFGNGDGILDSGEILGAQFFDGTVTFDYVGNAFLGGDTSPLQGNGVSEIVIDVTGSEVQTAGNVSVNLSGTVSEAVAGFARFEDGQFAGSDFADLVGNPLIDIDVTGGTNLLDAEQAPTLTTDSILEILEGVYGAGSDIAIRLAALVQTEVDLLGIGDAATYVRTTTLPSADIEFDVPAPATLGLLGLGLLGLGRQARKQRS